jgi:hypothetical protein
MLSLKTVIDRLKGYDSYELRDGVIRRRCALFREDAPPSARSSPGLVCACGRYWWQ